MTEAVDKGYNKIKFQKYDIHGILSKYTAKEEDFDTYNPSFEVSNEDGSQTLNGESDGELEDLLSRTNMHVLNLQQV